MISVILKSQFVKMPWKNGRGTTTQTLIYPPEATLEKNNYVYRLSSAPIEQDVEFSVFTNKRRLLTPIKGAGFSLNSNEYQKFEVADFSGNDKTVCSLLKGPIVDFGVILDSSKIDVQVKVLHLKSDFSFSLNPESEHLFVVLAGELKQDELSLTELEFVHYTHESSCVLSPIKSVILFYLKIDWISN